MGRSSALLTDRYEISGAQVSLASGVADRPAVFEVFARDLPGGRRYGIFCGLERVLRLLEDYRYTEAEMEWLRAQGIGDEQTWDLLQGRPFGGEVWAYREGEVYFPRSPVVRVHGGFAECLLLETFLLGALNWDSGVATTAARMVSAAKGKGLIEMGSRRQHEQAAVATARAAWIAGFDSTSNLEAGRTWGVPTAGTAQHALVLAHAQEIDAFAAQVRVQGVQTTILADTYDWHVGLRHAISAGGRELRAVRIDCDDLAGVLPEARRILDSMGATQTRIVCSGGLDEFDIERLGKAGASAFGIGERLVFPKAGGSPGFVYKLVEIDGRAVAKTSVGKENTGGRKSAWRRYDGAGKIIAEEAAIGANGRREGYALQVQVAKGGRRCWEQSTAEVRARCLQAQASLSEEDLLLAPGQPRLRCTMWKDGVEVA